jgi:hypothetical protein
MQPGWQGSTLAPYENPLPGFDGNASIGIAGGGNGFATIVSDSQSNNNGSYGITATGEISNSEADNNRGYGILGVTVTDSTAKGMRWAGLSCLQEIHQTMRL